MKVWLHTTKGIRNFNVAESLGVLTDREADGAGLCKKCTWDKTSHPIVKSTGVKLCTLDFKRKVVPSLRKAQLA